MEQIETGEGADLMQASRGEPGAGGRPGDARSQASDPSGRPSQRSRGAVAGDRAEALDDKHMLVTNELQNLRALLLSEQVQEGGPGADSVIQAPAAPVQQRITSLSARLEELFATVAEQAKASQQQQVDLEAQLAGM